MCMRDTARGDDCFQAWEETISQTFVPLRARPSRSGSGKFHGEVTTTPLGCVSLSEVHAARAVIERTPLLIRRSDPELYKVGMQISGTSVIEQAGRETLLRPGDLAIYDTSRPYRIAVSDHFAMSVAMFPRDRLRLPASLVLANTAVRLDGREATGSLLTQFIRDISRTTVGPPEVSSRHLGDALIDLTGAVLAHRFAQGTDELRLSASLVRLFAEATDYIDRHLTDPDLSPHTVAKAHFVSLRQLQKAFEATNSSVASAIRTRRLELCSRDLASPAHAHEPVAMIGAKWGFRDPSHFSRLFRAAFGLTPRDYRRAHGGGHVE